MTYLMYVFLLTFYIILINVKTLDKYSKKVWLKLKSSKNFIAGLLASLGISNLANKIDYLVYWDIVKIKELWFSIILV